MSSVFHFNREVRKALDTNCSLKDRRWAIWRCSYCIGSLCHAETKEVYEQLADKVGFNKDRNPSTERMPSEDQILNAIGILVHLRFRLLEGLRSYQIERVANKRSGKLLPD